MSTDNEQLVLDMFRAVEDRDGDRLLEIYDPDVEFVWPPELPYGGEYRGDGVVAMSEAFANAWDPVQHSDRARHPVEWLHTTDGRVVVTGQYRGTAPMTGKPFVATFVHIFTLDEGQIVELRQVSDTRCWPDV